MKLFDIHRKAIKIPLTQYYIPIPLFITSLIGIFGTAEATPKGCIHPTGPYETSCSPNSVQPYVSSDPNVPTGCVLTTKCNTMFSGLPPIPNKIYFAQGEEITNANNNNGTLSFSRAEREATAQINAQPPCSKVPLEGSFRRTCTQLSTSLYKSTDPNLQSTTLCKARFSCEDVGKHFISGITVWYDRTRGGSPVGEYTENCDGKLKVGPHDNECLTIEDIVRNVDLAHAQDVLKLL